LKKNTFPCQFHYEYSYLFIESVGALKWINYPFMPPPPSSVLGVNCFKNQNIFYKNNRQVEFWDFLKCPCGYKGDYMGIKPVSNDNYSVFIQRDIIEIFSPFNMNVNVSIYDINGRLCYTRDNISDNRHAISTVAFSNGIYILSIYDKEKRQISSKKIVLY